MSDWRSISTKPDTPQMVIFYSTTLMLINYSSGAPISPKLETYRDEAYSLGFYDGTSFHELGTGHDIFEFDGDEAEPNKPTHWHPLPAPMK